VAEPGPPELRKTSGEDADAERRSSRAARLVLPVLLFIPGQIAVLLSPFVIGAIATPVTRARDFALVIGSWLVLVFPTFWAADIVVRASPAVTGALLLFVTPGALFFVNVFAQVTYRGSYDEVGATRRDKPSSWGINMSTPPSGGGTAYLEYTGRWVLARLFAFALVLATAFFALLTTLLVQFDALDVTGGALRPHWYVSSFRNYYLWNAAEAIPILEVPQTLDWQKPFVIHGYVAGTLLLVYKILLLVPLVRIADLFFKERRKAERDEARSPALSGAPATSAHGSTLTLEAEAGSAASGLFVVENGSTERISARIEASPLTDPQQRPIEARPRFEPDVVTLDAGEKALVRATVPIDDQLRVGVDYIGTVTVPGLTEAAVPLVVRRR
jgi:hypothetical protein